MRAAGLKSERRGGDSPPNEMPVCPRCSRGGFRYRSASSSVDGGGRYICYHCGHVFSEPEMRRRRFSGEGVPTREPARTLYEIGRGK